MPALNRINLSVDDETLEEFKELQELRNAPSLAQLVLDLARERMEAAEDAYIGRIIEERKNEKCLSEKEFWREVEG